MSESTGGGVRNGSFREDLGLVRDLPHSLLISPAPQRAVGELLQHIASSEVVLGKRPATGTEVGPCGGLKSAPPTFLGSNWELQELEIQGKDL